MKTVLVILWLFLNAKVRSKAIVAQMLLKAFDLFHYFRAAEPKVEVASCTLCTKGTRLS